MDTLRCMQAFAAVADHGSFARAAEAVLGISLPVLQVVAAFRPQLTASIFGVAVAVGTGWLIVGHLDALTGVTLATATGLIVMAAICLGKQADGKGIIIEVRAAFLGHGPFGSLESCGSSSSILKNLACFE